MQQKQHSWTLLQRVSGLFNLSWLCFGDFNEILNLNGKCGGKDRNLNIVTSFREVVQDRHLNMVTSFREVVQACNLVDLGYTGYDKSIRKSQREAKPNSKYDEYAWAHASNHASQ